MSNSAENQLWIHTKAKVMMAWASEALANVGIAVQLVCTFYLMYRAYFASDLEHLILYMGAAHGFAAMFLKKAKWKA